jgi:hypothetical protein
MGRMRHGKRHSSRADSIPSTVTLSCPSPTKLNLPEVHPIVSTEAPIASDPKVSFGALLPDYGNTSSPRITNLCTAIANHPQDHPYGFLQGDACQYLVQPLKGISDSQNYITLENLLSKTSLIKITRRQRFEIALILASTHIQLHPTPWLKLKWNKRDVFFPYSVQDPNKICTNQPYISRSLSKSLNITSAAPQERNDSYNFQSSVRNLGVMLLELCFGSSIEEHRICRSMPASTEEMADLVNYMAATEWLRDVVEEAGPEYSDAVTWCLYYAPESSGTVGKDDQWREAMFAKVVEPLTYCHDQLTSI